MVERCQTQADNCGVIELWTDGACSGAPGAGGWAAILVNQDDTKLAISGWEPQTTNNRMELMAVVQGLSALGANRAEVTIFTDSAYVRNAFTSGWVSAWQKSGWVSSRGAKVANRDLWEQLIEVVARHDVRWRHIRGHSTFVLNNMADAMAVNAKKAREGVTRILP